MSGAEALVAFGIATNVVQFVDFTAKLCTRIKEYSTAAGIPRKLAAQADRLSDLLAILDSISDSSKENPLDYQVLSRCYAQAQELSTLLDSLKGDGQGRIRNARKAFKSLSRADEIDELQTALDSLVDTLNLQLQADTRSTARQVEAHTISILERQLEQSSLLHDLQQSAAMKAQIDNNAGYLNKSLWMVSVGRNPDFVGRSEVMSALALKLLPQPDAVPTTVLCGLGGVGKSQIALEYAYRERERFPDTSIFWVHASNTARFVESYKRIANEAKIPGRDDANSDVLQLVRNWLEGKYQCKWLMIVDNVDDRNMFFENFTYAGKALREYIPQSPKGMLIYTTRNRDIGVDLSLDRDPIIVSSMDQEEAQLLLGKKIRAESTEAEQLELLDELVYLPLAISQAVAFMAKRRKSVAEYIQMYRQSESTRIRLLGQRFNHHGREARPLESVVTTWWISFNYVKTENPRAAELLSFMSFLDWQGIPFSLLTLEGETTFDFEEAMGLLEAFSLVTLDTQRYACNIHRLVGVAVHGWLMEYENKSEIYATHVLGTLADRFPAGFFDDWDACAAYFPHAETVLRYNFIQSTAATLIARATLLVSMSTYLRTQGRYQASESGAEEAMLIYERVYGRENVNTLYAIANYARTIHRLGRYEAATALQRQVLEGREKVLGPSHRATLESLNALGSDLQTLGRYKEAEVIHRRELDQKKKLLEQIPGDPGLESDVLIAMNNVARGLSSQGKYRDAESIHRQALEKSLSVIGKNHPDTFITQGELAGTVRDQGRLQEAEEMYKKLLENRLAVLGNTHPDTLITLGNMATVAARQGKQEEAEETYKQVYLIEKASLGEKHPSTLNVRHNMACSAFDQGRYEEAEKSFKSVLEAQDVVLGLQHPDTLQTRRNVAASLRKLRKHEEADETDRQTLGLAENLEENKDAEKVQGLHNLAHGLIEQGRLEESERVRREELEIRLRLSGKDDDGTQDCMSSLAYLVSEQDKYDEAVALFQEVLDYRTRKLGNEDKDTLSTLWNLALAYRDKGDFEQAEVKYQELVNTQSRILGPDDPQTLESLIQLAWSQQQEAKNNPSKYLSSEANYRRLFKARSAELGLDDPLTLMVMNNLASVLKYQDGASEEAATLLHHVYERRAKVLGPDHGLSIKSLEFLADHLVDQGKHKEAEPLFRRLKKLNETSDVSEAEDEHEDCPRSDAEEPNIPHSTSPSNEQSDVHRNKASFCI